MWSANENLEDLNCTCVQSKQEQICTSQSSYQKPDENNNGISEFHHESTLLKVSSNLHTMSHHQVAEFFKELEITSDVSSDSMMDSLICKIQPVEENSVLSPLNYQDSELHSKIECLFEAMSSGMDSLTYQIQSFEQDPLMPSPNDQDWDYYPVIEFSPKTSDDFTANSHDYMESYSLTEPIPCSLQNILSLPDSEFHLNQSSTSNVDLTCENLSSAQDLLTPYGSANSTLSEILNTENPKKPKRTKCKCPNCNTKGGNRTRDSKGQLQHACHIPHCMKVFSTTSGLKRHLAIHKSYCCAHCSKEFELKREIRAHVKKHTSGKPKLVCPIIDCRKVYGHSGTFYRHLASHRNENNFICPYCYKKFSRNYILKLHVQVHVTGEKQKKCQCPNCSVEGGNNVRDSKGRLLHNCHVPDCGKVFTQIWFLKRHLEWDCGKRKFVCTHCNEGFQRKDYLEQHLQAHISIKHPKRCQCPKCIAEVGKKLKNLNRQYTCPFSDCKKVFTKAWDLKRHLVLHSRKESLFCAHCSKGFKCKRDLMLHLRKHMTGKRHKLKNSNANGNVLQSSTPGNQIHQVKSSRTKCQCPNCSTEGGNTTRDSNGRLQHICPILDCGRVFSRTSHLTEHLRRHSGEKYFFCPHCKKGFVRKSGLKSHLKIHNVNHKQNKCQISTTGRNLPIRAKSTTVELAVPVISMDKENFHLLCASQEGFLIDESVQPSLKYV